jgi:hypothetical protein
MVCVLLALAPSALAKDTSPLALTFGLGAQYDSNVIIDDADFNRRNGDGALLTSGTLSFAPLQTRKSSLRFAYTFDGVTNFKLPEVNLAIHGGSASASRRFGKVTLGLDYQFNHIVLGPRPYLDTHLVSPSLSILVTPRLLVRGAFFYQRKNFTSANRLDAHTKLIALDAYRFFSKRKGYIALGLRGDDESTTGAEFSYRAIQGSARVQVPLKVLGIDARIRASYAYSERSYRNETPSIAERRFEKRSTLTAGVDLPLGHDVTLKPQYRYVDRRSNVPAFNYRAHLASTMVTLKF